MTARPASTPTLAAVAAEAASAGLAVLGAFHPGRDDGAPAGCGTLALLGPDEPAFWPVFAASPEIRDGGADPLDRWSARVIGAMADRLGAVAVFPFGGPPHAPFPAWARRTGQAWISPVGLLVHATRGLQVSYRGALALPSRFDLPPAASPPCPGCSAPCRTACPVGALAETGYDTGACHAFLDRAAGRECRQCGCAVRRACPVEQGRRQPAQAGFHMAAFHGRQVSCDA